MGVNRKGNRSAKRLEGAALVKQAPQLMREVLAPRVEHYCDVLMSDLDDRGSFESDGKGGQFWRANPAHRTALELFPRILQAIGASEDLLRKIVERLNARDEEQLAQAMLMFHSAAGATVDDAERAAVSTIQTIVRAHPDKRARLMEACFGMRAPDAPRELEGRNGTT